MSLLVDIWLFRLYSITFKCNMRINSARTNCWAGVQNVRINGPILHISTHLCQDISNDETANTPRCLARRMHEAMLEMSCLNLVRLIRTNLGEERKYFFAHIKIDVLNKNNNTSSVSQPFFYPIDYAIPDTMGFSFK